LHRLACIFDAAQIKKKEGAKAIGSKKSEHTIAKSLALRQSKEDGSSATDVAFYAHPTIILFDEIAA
jgi:hypothetical protein